MTMNAAIRSTLISTAMLAVAACSQSGERVFTRQNQAASALATMGMEAEAANPDKLDRIYAAETQLFEACEPLRTVASHRMSGEEVGIDRHLVAFISLEECEVETTRVEQFIWLDNPTVARVFLGSKAARGAQK